MAVFLIDESEFLIDRQKLPHPSGRGSVFIFRVNIRTSIELLAIARTLDGEKSTRRAEKLQIQFLRAVTGIRRPGRRDLWIFPFAYRFNFPTFREEGKKSANSAQHETREERETIFKNLYRYIEPLLRTGLTLEAILDKMNLFQLIIRYNSLTRHAYEEKLEHLRMLAARNDTRELAEHYRSMTGSRSRTLTLEEAVQMAKERKKEGKNG